MTASNIIIDSPVTGGHGLRVLIADENPDSRFEMRQAVHTAGLELIGESGYGTEAVSLAIEVGPDAILLSMEEPAARAVDTAEALATALPETPLLVYSSRNEAEAVRRAMLIGARDYLVTPVESARVNAAVVGALDSEERRQMRQAGQVGSVGGRGTVITVAGAKGGVGKSVLSVNLALALRRETNRAVAVIDADTHFGDVATLLDLEPESSIADVVKRRTDLNRASVRELVDEHRSGVAVVAASHDEGAWEPCSVEDVQHIIDAFAQVYDYLVIDTSGAVDRFVRTCIEASTLTLMVSSGDVSSVRDTTVASRRLDGWGVPGDRIRYVMNSSGGLRGVPPADLAHALERDLFWVIPHDASVVESVQTGVPVIERGGSKAAESISGLARRIAGLQGESITSGRPAFWRRLISTKGASDDAIVAGVRQRVR